MDKITLAVLFGGCSPEHEVSILSAESIFAALNTRREKYEVVPVYITREGRWFMFPPEGTSLRDMILSKKGVPAALSPDRSVRGLIGTEKGEAFVVGIDAVFPALHGENGEDGTIQGLCRLAGLPCVGAGVSASAICADKTLAKRLAASIGGIKQTPWLSFNAGIYAKEPGKAATEAGEALGFPCFVKPAGTGSSLGISKAMDEKSFITAFQAAARHDRTVIAERAVRGRELEVGVLGNDHILLSAIGEIAAEADFYDYDAKYVSGGTRVIVPADITAAQAAEIRETAVKIYRATGCEGMARVDFFLKEDGELLFNEINTIPGFTAHSMYPKAFETAGIPLGELTDRLVELCLNKPSI